MWVLSTKVKGRNQFTSERAGWGGWLEELMRGDNKVAHQQSRTQQTKDWSTTSSDEGWACGGG